MKNYSLPLNRSAELEKLFLEFQQVSFAWNGRSEYYLTIDQGLKKLMPVIQQTLSPLLSKRAKELSREIVLGRNCVHQRKWEEKEKEAI